MREDCRGGWGGIREKCRGRSVEGGSGGEEGEVRREVQMV